MEVRSRAWSERLAGIVFVGAVTCYMLWRLLAATGGAGSAVEVVVYGATAAFGLEFLMSSWRGLWRGPRSEG
jgi:hypothetical protein